MEGTWHEVDRQRKTHSIGHDYLTCWWSYWPAGEATDLHGEGGVGLFEEDVPHVECTLHARCEEHTWTSGAPAAISQVRCTVPVSVCVCVCVCVHVVYKGENLKTWSLVT